jgi:hypothetical protein
MTFIQTDTFPSTKALSTSSTTAEDGALTEPLPQSTFESVTRDDNLANSTSLFNAISTAFYSSMSFNFDNNVTWTSSSSDQVQETSANTELAPTTTSSLLISSLLTTNTPTIASTNFMTTNITESGLFYTGSSASAVEEASSADASMFYTEITADFSLTEALNTSHPTVSQVETVTATTPLIIKQMTVNTSSQVSPQQITTNPNAFLITSKQVA